MKSSLLGSAKSLMLCYGKSIDVVQTMAGGNSKSHWKVCTTTLNIWSHIFICLLILFSIHHNDAVKKQSVLAKVNQIGYTVSDFFTKISSIEDSVVDMWFRVIFWEPILAYIISLNQRIIYENLTKFIPPESLSGLVGAWCGCLCTINLQSSISGDIPVRAVTRYLMNEELIRWIQSSTKTESSLLFQPIVHMCLTKSTKSFIEQLYGTVTNLNPTSSGDEFYRLLYEYTKACSLVVYCRGGFDNRLHYKSIFEVITRYESVEVSIYALVDIL